MTSPQGIAESASPGLGLDRAAENDRLPIIFHHPSPLAPEGRSGTTVRPQKMLRAFHSLGYEVEEITGYSDERARKIGRIAEQMRAGRRFEFAYAESHTLPTPLTDRSHLPVRALLDYRFFSRLNQAGVPFGLFYRDIYWRFESSLGFRSPLKRSITVSFHRFEWRRYRATVDHLFLPSSGMAKALPTPWPADRLSALPPGGEPVEHEREASRDGPLRLLYVGGVSPPLYDLEPLFLALSAVREVKATLCCRPEEWNAVAGNYDVPDNVSIAHVAGAGLEALYDVADLVVMLRKKHPYLDFAMPVKLMEAVSHGLPVIISSGSEAARFVQRESLGWVVESPEEATRLIASLAVDREALAAAASRVAAARSRHTWQARAEQVSGTLRGARL